jgi:predicted nucleic acid-binding protein
MEDIVLDASITMTWCYPDEHSNFAYRVLDLLEHKQAVVPSLWAIEVANALVVGERRQRLTASDIARFFELLRGLSIETDTQTSARALSDTLQLARTHNLSAYDAVYLELAMREGLVLATLDERLKTAAKRVGVQAFV